MTISKAMNISLTGLKANQSALNVVSHNIANMNTEGYVRQRVNFAEVRTPVNGNNSVDAQIASLCGVKVAGISTAANDYMNNYYRSQLSNADGLAAEADTAAQIANLLDELAGSGLGDTFNEFFNSANALSQNPTDYSLRINFVEKAKTVADKFNLAYTNIQNLKSSKIGDGTQESANASQAGTYVSQLNDDLKTLETVNRQISENPADASLKSQRDQLLADIAGLANVRTAINESGTASVFLGNNDILLSSHLMGEFSIEANGSIKFTNEDGTVKDVTPDLKGGKLGGTLSGAAAVDDALIGIDKLADAFATVMNGIQKFSSGDIAAASYNRATDRLVLSSEDLFTTSDGSGTFNATNIRINDTVYNDPDLVAAARVDTSVTDWERSVGNGDNALEFYMSQSTKVPSLGYLTLNDYIRSLSTKAALDAGTKQNEADIQAAVADGIQAQILAETGVNLDEELTNMLIYQQAYNASARVFTTCVQVYDTLLELGK